MDNRQEQREAALSRGNHGRSEGDSSRGTEVRRLPLQFMNRRSSFSDGVQLGAQHLVMIYCDTSKNTATLAVSQLTIACITLVTRVIRTPIASTSTLMLRQPLRGKLPYLSGTSTPSEKASPTGNGHAFDGKRSNARRRSRTCFGRALPEPIMLRKRADPIEIAHAVQWSASPALSFSSGD